jgi:hypothetical protein
MYRGTYAPDYYRVLHTVTHKKFRIWQSRDLLHHALRHPREVTPKLARRIGASLYHRLTLPALERKLDSLT